MPKKLLLCLIILGMTACSNQSHQRAQPSVSDGLPSQLSELPLEPSSRSSAAWLDDAQIRQGSARIDALLQAARAMQKELNWQGSAVVIGQIERFQERIDLTPEQIQLIAILEARFAAQEARWPYVEKLIAPLLKPRLAPQLEVPTLELALAAAKGQQHWHQAASYQLQLLNYAPEHTEPKAVWEVLKFVSKPNQLDLQTAVKPHPDTLGWYQLLQALHSTNATTEELALRLESWTQEFDRHPALEQVQQLKEQIRPTLDRAVIILPLSGQYREQGQAVRDGMIKALTRQPELQATFIDSNRFNFDELPELLQRKQAGLLIGPLLKQNITKIDSDMLPSSLRWLTLNEPTDGLKTVLSQQNFFALDTETEVQQAARHMASQGFEKPLVLAPESQRGKHLANVFAQAWQAEFADKMRTEIGTYSNTDEMKTAVQDRLGVSASEARIWQVKIAGGKIIVDSQARSRPDIDAIYLVGGIEQTRLLKPFIDVNIAPFMQQIPVFSNSGSHTLNNDLSENDLDGVHFTDAPWLMPGHQQQAQMKSLLQLRSHWDYNLLRLAAFGHDSILLSQQLALLQTVPGKTLNGLTGALHIERPRVIRELSWARYRGHQVIAGP